MIPFLLSWMTRRMCTTVVEFALRSLSLFVLAYDMVRIAHLRQKWSRERERMFLAKRRAKIVSPLHFRGNEMNTPPLQRKSIPAAGAYHKARQSLVKANMGTRAGAAEA